MEAVGVQGVTLGSRRVVWHAVATSAVLHLLAALFLLPHFVPGRQEVRNELAPVVIRLIAPPAGVLPESARDPEPRRNKQLPRPLAGRSASAADVPRVEDKGSVGPAAATPLSPSLSVDVMIDAAKRNIGSIDRELRQAFPSRVPAPAQPASTPLERGIAAAGLPRGTIMQEMALGDGRRVTKVITPSGTYCVLGRKPGAGITENELAALTTTNCPN
jgi:hypothetical protein